MEIRIEGCCRRRYHVHTKNLPLDPRPTNQRAELTAIILALREALSNYRSKGSNSEVDVTIYSDSQYAVGCMNRWLDHWLQNGWRNAAGKPVANRDLIMDASRLHDMVRSEMGDVSYVWIPREENDIADRYCNEALDRQEQLGIY